MRTPSATRVLRDHPSAALLAVQLVAVLAHPFFDDSPVCRGVRSARN